MIYLRLGMLIIALLAIWGIIKLLRSPKWDKFCNNMAKGDLDVEPDTKDTMKNITTTEKGLGKQADKNNKQAEKLKTESNGINDFLGKRGVTDTEKREDC